MRSRVTKLAALSFAVMSTPASAVEQYCTGTVLSSWVNDVGAVLLSSSWRGDHTQVCNIETTWKGIPPNVCVSWVAKIDAALALSKRISIYYRDAPACNLIPYYGEAPAPYYVMLIP